jgi:hypothetical protein
MTINQDEFFQNLDAENITPEQAAQMLEFGLEGDTGTMPETVSEAPDAPTEQADVADQGAGDSSEAGQEAQAEPEPVLLAKDGKHTIPYEKLVEAREGERHWKAQAEAAAAELDKLREQAQTRADAGEAPTVTDQNAAIAQEAIDQGIDPDIFGDFSEEDLAKGVLKLIDQRMQQQAQQMTEQQTREAAAKAHYDAIYAVHPDADSIIESKELGEWVATQPAHVKLGIETVLNTGSAQQVVDVFTAFKQATGKAQSADDIRAKARQAAESAKQEPPVSLSDIPGGRASGATLEEQVAGLDGTDLLERMQDMSPDQIESLLNRLI